MPALPRRQFLTPALALLLALTVGLVGEYMVRLERYKDLSEQRARVASMVGELRAALEGELNATLYLTQGMTAYVANGSNLTPEVFKPMLRTLFRQGRNVRSMGLAPGNRLTYVYPFEGNESAIGLYYPDNKDQWPAVERAIREHHPVLAGPVRLTQGGIGLLYRVPLFLGPDKRYWGLLSMVIDLGELYHHAGIAPVVQGLDVALRGRDGTGPAGEVFFGNPALFNTDAVTALVTTPGGTWQIAARPAMGWGHGTRFRWLSTGAWLLGILLGVLFYQSQISAERRRKAEESLRLSLDQLNEAQRIAMVGNWTLDLRSNHLEWSDEVYRIFEIDPAEFGATYEAFLATVHPDDRERVDRTHAESKANHTPYEVKHRLLFPDGRVKYVEELAEAEFAEDGTPLLYRGTVQDITVETLAEESLYLFANAFQYSGEAMLISDRENRIVAVNPAFTRETGFAIQDLYGKNPSVLASGHTPRDTYQAMWAMLQETGYWQGELWDRRSSGEIYPKWTRISVIRNEQGDITHYIANFTDLSERKAAEERIHRLAHHDPLTNLFNRFSLESQLEQALRTARRERQQLAVMFIDMDRFKDINDTLGHPVGDALLVKVSARLMEVVRESDIVARLGGDEFVVVLTGMDAAMAVTTIAGKIIHALEQPYHAVGHTLNSSASIGISLFPGDGDNVETLMKNADTALYHAKGQGRNNYQFFTSAMTAAANERMELERDLRAALAERQFVLHYQPQIESRSGKVRSVEALIRWQHPSHGFITPLKFIPIAEDTGLIEQIGEWVLDEACRQQAIWRDEGFTTLRMAVNLSAQQLRSPVLVDRVREIMAKHETRPSDLELEVTESATMDDPERAVGQLIALRELGLELAIDDFGTGYSSLAYLKMLPIQRLKLDRTFVNDIETDENDAAISAATISLAHTLGLEVVAEGIETTGQRRFLAEQHDCDYLQGYLFSRPLPANEATQYLNLVGVVD